MRDHDNNCDSGTDNAGTGRRRVLALSGGLLTATALGSIGSVSAEPSEIELTEDPGANSPGSGIAPADGWASTDWLTDRPLQVVRVTNLEAGGPGSFKHAVEDVDGPRIVVFEVGGVIDMQQQDIEAEEPDLFVAGQTAPDPGITITRTSGPGVEFDEENMLVQHIRSRPGTDIEYGEPADSMVVGDDGHNVIFDHCSVSWGSEENMSVNAGSASADITFSNNINGEGLKDTTGVVRDDGDDQRAYGTLVGNEAETTAILGNLYANNWRRNVRLKGGTSTVVASNVTYNVEAANRIGGDIDDPSARTSFVANAFRSGDESDFSFPFIYTGDETPIDLHVSDNDVEDSFQLLDDDAVDDGIIEVHDEPPLWPDGLTPVQDPFGQQLNTVGARPAQRTPIDERIVEHTIERGGTHIDSQDEVGGYPDLPETERELSIPSDPDDFTAWLQQHTRAVELPGETAPN
ncbi:pectate lyase [Halostagnicola bangensis]